MRQHEHREKSLPPCVRTPVLCIAALVCAWAAACLWAILSDDLQSYALLTSLRSYVTGADASGGPDQPVPAAPSAGSVSAAAVDLDGLQEINPDICGWIDIPGTNISYPVVQGPDNAYYLRRGPDGEENRAGSIFLDAGCDGFAGRNTILYGHRMNNGTMFAELHRFEDGSFRSAHPYICIYTSSGETVYEIFEVSESDAALSAPAYLTEFIDAVSFRAWGARPAGETCYMFQDPQLAAHDRVLTLSTCVRGNGSRRFIVRARALSEHPGRT